MIQSDYIAALATPTIHEDKGVIQAPKCASNANAFCVEC